MKTVKRIFFFFLLFISLSCLSQNGKILSKKRIELNTLPEKTKNEIFRFKGDSLRPEYRHLYKINMYAITYKSDKYNVSGVLIEPKKEGLYPAIIFNRGGHISYGRLTPKRMPFSSLTEIASEGYVVIASNYREKDEYGGKDINDVLYLLESLKEVKNADIDRIGMYGWSRGGIMTYLALKQTGKIKTAIIGSSPVNMFDVVKDRPNVESKILSNYIPDYWANKNEELKKRSVVFWANKLNKNTSLLLLYGTEDKRVSDKHAYQIEEKLKEIGYNFELRKFNTGHSFKNMHKELVSLEIEWFNKKLKTASQ